MPVYEYQCDKCGVRFDRLESMSATPTKECPECGGSVHRVISSVGVIFKGSGFYVTDNRKSSSPAARNLRKSDDSTDIVSDKAEKLVEEKSPEKEKSNTEKSSKDTE